MDDLSVLHQHVGASYLGLRPPHGKRLNMMKRVKHDHGSIQNIHLPAAIFHELKYLLIHKYPLISYHRASIHHYPTGITLLPHIRPWSRFTRT